MVLYTCPARTFGPDLLPIKHPCAVAAKALDEAGHSYELKVVGGFKEVPLSRRGRRKEIIALSGQEDVPLIVLDDGEVVYRSGEIVAWARSHPA